MAHSQQASLVALMMSRHSWNLSPNQVGIQLQGAEVWRFFDAERDFQHIMRFWGTLFVQIDLSSAGYSWEPKNGQNLKRPLVMNMTKVRIIVSHPYILSTPKQIVYQTSYEPTFPSAYRLDFL
jgi:hypothetical protein